MRTPIYLLTNYITKTPPSAKCFRIKELNSLFCSTFQIDRQKARLLYLTFLKIEFIKQNTRGIYVNNKGFALFLEFLENYQEFKKYLKEKQKANFCKR